MKIGWGMPVLLGFAALMLAIGGMSVMASVVRGTTSPEALPWPVRFLASLLLLAVAAFVAGLAGATIRALRCTEAAFQLWPDRLVVLDSACLKEAATIPRSMIAGIGLGTLAALKPRDGESATFGALDRSPNVYLELGGALKFNAAYRLRAAIRPVKAAAPRPKQEVRRIYASLERPADVGRLQAWVAES
jgi:hypothetical protein